MSYFSWLTDPCLPCRILTSLGIAGQDITTLPPLAAQLQVLHVSGCKNLRSLPGLPASLHVLRCDECAALTALPSSLSRTAVKELYCDEGCVSLRRLPKLPESLRDLQADNCKALTEVTGK
jgi:hypothetical protein